MWVVANDWAKVRYSGSVIGAEISPPPTVTRLSRLKPPFQVRSESELDASGWGQVFRRDLDSMQKAQIKPEQNCASRTDDLPQPGCAATKEDLK
jgi:hypothetical protein